MVLLAHWPIDDGVEDNPTTARDVAAGGSGSHAGTYNLASHGTMNPGGVGSRHLLSFSGGYIQSIGNPADFRNLHGEMTAAAWIWVDEFSPTYGFYTWSYGARKIVNCAVASAGTSATNNSFYFKTNGRKLYISWQHGSNLNEIVETGSDVLEQMGPQHVAVVRYFISGSDYGVRFYVDGVEVDDLSSGYQGPDGCDNAVPYVAADYGGGNSYPLFIDSVRVYDEALNGTAIETIYDDEYPSIFMPVNDNISQERTVIGDGDPYTLVHNGPFSNREDAGWGAI